MMIPKEDRNEEIVALRDKNPRKWTYSRLAEKYGLSTITVWEIYNREKGREAGEYDVPPTIRKRYQYLKN